MRPYIHPDFLLQTEAARRCTTASRRRSPFSTSTAI